MKKRKDGRYLRQITVDGKKLSFYSSAQTERAAEKDIAQQLLDYKMRIQQANCNFKMLSDAMLESRDGTISYNTQECYTHAIKHLSPFYEMDIADITPGMLQTLIDGMVREGYGYSAVNKTKIVFGLIIDYAIVHNNLKLQNFTHSIKIPKTIQKHKVAAPPDAILKAVISNKNAQFGMWAFCLLCTGLRRGELAALQKRDIDFSLGLISVTKSVEFIHNQPHVKSVPKTESSIGDVPIISILAEPLREMVSPLSSDDYIFGGETPLSETMIKKRWKKYCAEIGYNITGHQLRHGYAKLLYKSGVDVKTAQRLLRHANFNTTMNIYTDFSNEMTDKSVELLNNYLNDL